MQKISNIYYYDIGNPLASPHHRTAPGSQSATDLSVINVPEVAISNPGMAKNSDNDL